MNAVRRIAATAVLGVLVTVPLRSQQQEIDPNRLFVRVQTQLLAEPTTPATPQTPILRPGTLVTALPDTLETGGLVQVTTDQGQKGWLVATSVRPLAVLEAEQALEPFTGLGPMSRGRGLPQARAQCPSFASCPVVGCAPADGDPACTRTDIYVPIVGAGQWP